VNRSVSCESRSLVGAGSRLYRWFLVARGRCLLEPHSMRGRATVHDCRCSPAGLGCRTMSFSCPGGLSQRNSPAGWTRRRQDWSAPVVIVAGHITVEPQRDHVRPAGRTSYRTHQSHRPQPRDRGRRVVVFPAGRRTISLASWSDTTAATTAPSPPTSRGSSRRPSRRGGGWTIGAAVRSNRTTTNPARRDLRP
jgi:hypothetical protein